MADTILSLLEPGEYVLNRNAVDKLGKKALDEINYKEAPRFPDKSILGDYFGQQEMPNFWTGMVDSLMQGSPKKKSTSPQDIDLRGREEEMGFGEGEDIEIPSHILQKYQDGGSVSYGGYESENPSLTSLYEMFGVKPNEKNLKRFQEYDPSREGVHYEDYQTALDKSRTTGTRGMEQLYGETAGVGGFAGSGAAEKERGRGRKSLMEDYLSGQKSAYSSLFKGVRSERENWLKEMGSQLSALEERGGSDEYTTPGDTEIPAIYDVPEDDPSWAPPLQPSSGESYKFGGQTYYWSGNNWETEAGWEEEQLGNEQQDYDYGP